VHRMLFRRHQKNDLVELTSRLAAIGLVFLSVAVLSAVLLVVSVVVNLTVAIVIAGCLGLVLIGAWYVLPSEIRRRRPSRDLRTE
jgi:hypothetical protein